MIKKKDEDTHEKGAGIPRTHGAAKKLRGYKKSNFKFDDLSDDFKANFVKMANAGARAGSYCGAVTSPNNRAYWLVCYKNARGSCHWVELPKGSSIPPNDPS